MWDERFEQLLRAYLPLLAPDEQLTADTVLRDLGLDSMATVELLAAVEGAYDVRFADEALSLSTFATAGTLWATLAAMLEPAQA